MNKFERVIKHCIVPNKKGLHARAAAQIVAKSSEFDCEVSITHQQKSASSLSLIKLLTLDAPQGSKLILSAQGQQAQQAIDAVCSLIENGFGELDCQ